MKSTKLMTIATLVFVGSIAHNAHAYNPEAHQHGYDLAEWIWELGDFECDEDTVPGEFAEDVDYYIVDGICNYYFFFFSDFADSCVDGALLFVEEKTLECSSPTECGDPEVMARFEECKDAEDEVSCEDAGGTWVEHMGLMGRPGCLCPTGQENCLCTDSADCLSVCMASSDDVCGDATQGFCSSRSPQFGCFCMIEDGHGVMICFD